MRVVPVVPLYQFNKKQLFVPRRFFFFFNVLFTNLWCFRSFDVSGGALVFCLFVFFFNV